MRTLLIISIIAMFLLAAGCQMPKYTPIQDGDAHDDSGDTDVPEGTDDMSDDEDTEDDDSDMSDDEEEEEDDSDEEEADDDADSEDETDEEDEEEEEDTQTEVSKDGTITLKEGELLELNLKATDPDGDPLTYTFDSPLDDEGKWQTKMGDAGEYDVTITVSDGTVEVSKDILVIVESVNGAPVLQRIKDITVNEGEPVTITPVAIDPDGDKLSYAYSGWMTSPTYTTTYDDAGEWEVKVTVTDSFGADDSQVVGIIVEEVNREPVIDFEALIS